MTMNRTRLTFALVLVLTLTSGCASLTPPPTLTPEAVIAFHALEVIHDLDRIRDVAVAAHQTSPPLLDAATTLQIVTWHEGAITVAHSATQGWKAAVATSLNALNANLPAHAKQVIGPYVEVAYTILREVVAP